MLQLTAEEIPELLARLVDKSLVQLDVDGRYSFLQLVRSFAQEELMRTRDSGITRNHHFEFYYGFSKMQGDAMFGMAPVRAIHQFEDEIDNVRAAEEWAIANPETWNQATEMFNDLCHFLSDHGWFGDGAALMEAAIQNAPEGSDFGIASALAWLAVFQLARLDPAAEDTCQRAIEIGKKSNNMFAIARGYAQMAQIRRHQKRLEESDAFAEQALALARAGDLKRWIGGILVMLGSSALLAGNLGRAKEFYQQCYEHCSSIKILRGLASAQGNLGHVHERLGEYQEAYRNYFEAARAFYSLGNLRNVGGVLAGSACGFWLAGDDRSAAMILGAADALWKNLKTYPDEVDSETAERWRARLVERMGPEAFLAAFEKGAETPLGEIVQLVLDHPEPWSNPPCRS